MFSKTYNSSQNLDVWRKLRKNKTDVDDILSAFSFPPEKTRYIDYYTPANWPNVFEIVGEGMFCQSGITLVLTSTLHYAKIINSEQIQLDVISNNILGTEGLVLKIDKHYYNFLPGEISTEKFVLENGVKFDTHIITVDKLFD
jgi:hypothetical protein